MARTIDKAARIVEQCARGRRIRNIQSLGFTVAAARTTNVAPNHTMADLIQNETEVFGFFVAPCACKVLRIVANGTPFVDMATGGSVTAKLTKAVIGGADVDLCSTIAIGAETVPATDTPIDATLSSTDGALDLIDGQHIYATVVVSNHAVETAVAHITLAMEWIPMDIGYPSS